MTIAFDGNKAANNRAGLGNYSRFIIRILAERFPDWKLDVYVKKVKHPELLEPLLRFPNVELVRPDGPIWKLFPNLWERFAVARLLERRGTDIYHGLSNVLPAGAVRAKGVKTAVSLHDLIFLILPYTYSWIDRHIFSSRFRKACLKADRIISVSDCTAEDIFKYFMIPKQKISVIYQGCDNSFGTACPEAVKAEIRKKYSLPDKYILSVGTIERRKNTALIVRALAKVPEINLVLVGKRTKYTCSVEDEAAALGLTSRLHILEGVPTQDLPAIYQQSEIFVYPSEYEGFGIPVLEALRSGIPVIAATGSCLEEAGGPDSVYIGPEDADGLASAISKILSDRELREKMIRSGRNWAERFSDRAVADSLAEFYRSL